MRREPEVDRAAWAEVVESALGTIPRRNKAELARRIGVDTKTVSRWLNQEVDVSEESARTVARVFHMSAPPLLVRLGFYRPEDFGLDVGDDALPPEDEESIRLIMQSEAPDEVKDELVREIRRMQRQHADERTSFAQRLLDMARRVRGTT